MVSRRTPRRAVWRVRSSRGELVLKSHDSCQRATVAASAGRYLHRRGVPVAPPLQASDGRLVVTIGEDCFALFPWLIGELVRYEALDTILPVTALLAEFHQGTRGYMKSGGPRPESRLDWERIYRGRVRKLQAVKRHAEVGQDAFSKALRSQLTWVEARVTWAEAALATTELPELVSAARRDPLLGHGDFAGNVMRRPDGSLSVIDLDAVALHLPVWDLSRLISYVDHDMQSWDGSRYERMLAAYRAVRPLSMAEVELLRVDQVYPHHLVDLAAAYYEGTSTPTALEELGRIVRTDQRKLAYLGVDGLA